MKPLIMQFSLLSCYFLFLGPNDIHSTPLLTTFSLHIKFHMHTNNKVTILSILVFTIQDSKQEDKIF